MRGGTVERCSSTLLEEQPGALDDGAEEQEVPDPAYPEPFTQTMTVLDRDGYAAQVRDAAAGLAPQLVSSDQAVTAGQPFDLAALVARLHDRIRSGEPSGSRMEWERMCFEASTGVDCSTFYEQGRLQRLAALAVLEDFRTADTARPSSAVCATSSGIVWTTELGGSRSDGVDRRLAIACKSAGILVVKPRTGGDAMNDALRACCCWLRPCSSGAVPCLERAARRGTNARLARRTRWLRTIRPVGHARCA